MTPNFMDEEGSCRRCGLFERLANDVERYCITCYKHMIVPRVESRIIGSDEVTWTKKSPGHPHTACVPLRRKVVEDEENGPIV